MWTLDARLNECGIRFAECGIKIQNPRSKIQNMMTNVMVSQSKKYALKDTGSSLPDIFICYSSDEPHCPGYNCGEEHTMIFKGL